MDDIDKNKDEAWFKIKEPGGDELRFWVKMTSDKQRSFTEGDIGASWYSEEFNGVFMQQLTEDSVDPTLELVFDCKDGQVDMYQDGALLANVYEPFTGTHVPDIEDIEWKFFDNNDVVTRHEFPLLLCGLSLVISIVHFQARH